MAETTLKKALLNYSRKGMLRSKADQAHLKRWEDEAGDPIWEGIAHDIEAHEEMLPGSDCPFWTLIHWALVHRKNAERLATPQEAARTNRIDRMHRERVRADMLAFADKLKEIVEQHGVFARIRPPNPSGKPSEWAVDRNIALKWLKQEEVDLRRRAEVQTKDDNSEWVSVARRQSGGRGKRENSRNIAFFASCMVDSMNDWCGKPRYDAVATLTNIAFPNADVDAEAIRSFCRPTTRAGRRPKSGAHRP